MASEPLLSGIIILVASVDPLRELGTYGLMVLVTYLVGIPVMLPIALNRCRDEDDRRQGIKELFKGAGTVLAQNYGFILFICLVWPFAFAYFCLRRQVNYKLAFCLVVAVILGVIAFETLTRASSPTLLEALENNSRKRSNEAKKLLGARADPATIPPLIELVRNAPEEYIRENAMYALTRFKNPQMLPFLFETFTSSGGKIRLHAIRALHEYNDPGLIDDLVPLVGHRDFHQAKSATSLLQGLLDRLIKNGDPNPAEASELLNAQLEEYSMLWTQRNRRDQLRRVDKEHQKYLRRTLIYYLKVLVYVDTPLTTTALVIFIGNEDLPWDARVEAAKGIRHQSVDTETVQTLARRLEKMKGPGSRYHLIVSLGKIGDRSAVPYLVESLMDGGKGQYGFGDIQREAAFALGKLGWKPATTADVIHLAAAKKNKKTLLDRWQDTETVLLEDIVSGNARRFNNALLTFIRLGQESILEELNTALQDHGNVGMANAYLRSGNDVLNAAAVKWGKANGYVISKAERVTDYPKWGK